VVAGLLGTVVWALAIRWFLTRPRQEPGNPAQQVWLGFGAGRTDPAAVERAPYAFRRALLAHVSLVLEKRDGGAWSVVATGSGVSVATAPGEVAILTCRHVLEAGQAASGQPSSGLQAGFETGRYRLRARWFGGSTEQVAVLWTSLPRADLALLKGQVPSDVPLPASVPPADMASVGIGEDVFAVGDPLNFRASLVRGTLSAVRVQEDGGPEVETLQSQLPLNPGNSGGGLYNRDGELLGLNSWTIAKERAEGLGFSISVATLRSLLDGMPPEAKALLKAWFQAKDGAPPPHVQVGNRG
jgi:S1-C subfamily serine protease